MLKKYGNYLFIFIFRKVEPVPVPSSTSKEERIIGAITK